MAAPETRISDGSVAKGTGHTWAHWFGVLDDWGAIERGHKASAAYLHDEHDVPVWWAQMVTVQYERHKGIRQVGERAGRFHVSAQRTFDIDPDRAWIAMAGKGAMTTILGKSDPGEIAEAVPLVLPDGTTGLLKAVRPPKLLRFTWQEAGWARHSTVEVHLLVQPRGRTSVRVQHQGLQDEVTREAMRAKWRTFLGTVSELVEDL